MEETKTPGIALAVVGGLGILSQLLSMGYGAFVIATGGEAALGAGIGQAAYSCFGLLFAGFIVFGGVKLMKGESYGLCMAASIFAMLPFCGPGACCLLGLPVGIWAIISMNKVKDQFR